MALKAILLRHKIEAAEKNLEALRARSGELEKREKELTSALEEATAEGAQTSAEDMAILERDIDAHTQERDAHQQALTTAEQELEQLRADLAAEESRPVPAASAAPNHNNPERSDNTNMNTRIKFFGMTVQERDAFFANEEVKSWLQRVRAMKGQTRAVTGGELLIPTVVVDILREQIAETSKLMKHFNVRPLKGKGREIVPGTIPEAVWTEMCAKLNELVFDFNAVEVDGYKVGGYVPVCNALLEDNDVNLAYELIRMIGKAIGLGVDKAGIYGTGTKMPLGILTRLVTVPEQDSGEADLHTSNVIQITGTGATFFKNIVKGFGAAKNKYGAGGLFWAMNKKTHMDVVAESIGFNATGAVVAGMNNTMPVVGGPIEELEFIPDGVMVAGYGELYLLAERAGMKIGSSEHAMYIEDNTVFKGTARYDGKPSVPEGFVVLYTGNSAPTADAVNFAADTANAVQEQAPAAEADNG